MACSSVSQQGAVKTLGCLGLRHWGCREGHCTRWRWGYTLSEEMEMWSQRTWGIVIEGIKVMDNWGRVIMGFIRLFGLFNSLDLSFPDNLRYTFEFIQKWIWNWHKLNAKIQQLKIKLFAWAGKTADKVLPPQRCFPGSDILNNWDFHELRKVTSHMEILST